MEGKINTLIFPCESEEMTQVVYKYVCSRGEQKYVRTASLKPRLKKQGYYYEVQDIKTYPKWYGDYGYLHSILKHGVARYTQSDGTRHDVYFWEQTAFAPECFTIRTTLKPILRYKSLTEVVHAAQQIAFIREFKGI